MDMDEGSDKEEQLEHKSKFRRLMGTTQVSSVWTVRCSLYM